MGQSCSVAPAWLRNATVCGEEVANYSNHSLSSTYSSMKMLPKHLGQLNVQSKRLI